MVVYVDDILVTGTNLQTIESIKVHLHSTFSIKDLGLLHFFLGMETSHGAQGFILTQEKFTKELLADSTIPPLKKVLTPCPLTSSCLLLKAPHHMIQLFTEASLENSISSLILGQISPMLCKPLVSSCTSPLTFTLVLSNTLYHMFHLLLVKVSF